MIFAAHHRAGRQARIAALAVWTTLALLASADAGRAQARERIAVDRWLVSSPFPAAGEEDPLAIDYLAGPGEAGVLPDRGRTVAGADWTLVREDSAWVFSLPAGLDMEPGPEEAAGTGEDDPSDAVGGGEESKPEAPAGTTVVAYAHAYIRAPEDRTVRLVWGGSACTRVSAWLNGRRVDDLGGAAGSSAPPGLDEARATVARLGYGYNTLLLKAARGDCPFGLAAGLEAAEPGALEGVRVRASRPYGDTRTGPDPWIAASPDAGPEALLAWQGEELFGAAAIGLAAFAVTAVETAELKAEVAGRDVRRRVEWLEPASSRTVRVPFEFARLRRAVLRGEGLELEVEWDGSEWSGTLSLEAGPLLTAFASPIRLLGWSGPRPAAETGVDEVDEAGEPHPLSNLIPLPVEGETLVGEWQVPGWLSGFTLRLDTEGAPGSYRLASLPVEGAEVLLCRACEEGESVQIVVTAGGEWTSFPSAVIVDPLPDASEAGTSDGAAVRWLEWIDEDGSREFRERAAAAAGND